MDRLPLVRRERKVALDHQALGDGWIARESELRGDLSLVHLSAARERRLLAVHRDAPAGDGAVLQRASHQAGRGDGDAVVGEPGGTEIRELAHLRQLGAAFGLRDRREEPDGDLRFRAGALDEGAERSGGVDDRIRVRHREDRAVAAGRGRRGAARDRLLVLSARRAQMHVRVDERGREHEPVGFDDAVRVRLEVGSERGDGTIVDADVCDGVDALGGIDDAGAANDQVLARCVLAEQHQATSTGSPTLTGAGAPTLTRGIRHTLSSGRQG